MFASLLDSPLKERSVNTLGAPHSQVSLTALCSTRMRAARPRFTTSALLQDISIRAYDQELIDFSTVFDYDIQAATFTDQNSMQPPAKKTSRYKPVAQQQVEREQARNQMVMDIMSAAALLRDSSVIIWERQQDMHLLRAMNKTIPVVSVLAGGETIHLVGSSCVSLRDINIHMLPYPKSTTEIFFTHEEISAVLECSNRHLQDILLFINSKDIRVKGSEADAFKLQAKRRHKRLTSTEGITMADIMNQDLSTYPKTTCKICGKGTAIALLSCNNHMTKFSLWGDVI